MDVRHNANLTACGEVVVAHSADLLDSFILDDLGEADCGVYLPFDFHRMFTSIDMFFACHHNNRFYGTNFAHRRKTIMLFVDAKKYTYLSKIVSREVTP